MAIPFENIIKHLFHQPSLQSVTVEELQKMADMHPSFAAVRFLLLKKMQDASHPAFTSQLHQTTLYFNNPLWLQFLLQPQLIERPKIIASATATEEISEEEKIEATSVEPVVPVIEPTNDVILPETVINAATSVATGEALVNETVEQTMPGASQEKIIIETPEAKEDLLFEPYHTIDYFASQGIKLDKDPQPQDKFGRQLKSFTEWLRSMKKLPQADVNKALSENDESQVINAAAHSLDGKAVITEAMAEVFQKQGMHREASEVYRKLSLLNPSKSAYFAAKIEALKH